MADYDRWLWIELIGFDNTQADYGVGALLETAGFVPDAVSLLLFNPDFVHDHAGMGTPRPLPFDCCSYAGHPSNGERRRQDWTSHQLRGLVEALRAEGIGVWFAVFDLFVSESWLARHPEVRYVDRRGQRRQSVCPLKRLADGTFYEDFYIERVSAVARDYGFDGYHAADGYGHPRLPIYEGDFSDDLVEQFVLAQQVALPDELAGPCDGQPERISARADFILAHRRMEWLGFHRRRFVAFHRKLAAALHAVGRAVVLNSCWTRDPFEALYRYGVDTAALAECGIDGLVVEAAAAASETEREDASAAVLHEFAAMLLLTRVHTPTLPMRFLCGVKDTREQWHVLRHAPTSLEREIHWLAALRVTGAGGARRCADGLVVCLADAIRPHEWAWLRDIWNLAFAAGDARVLGATLVWSARSLDAQLEDYLRTRRPSVHRWLHQLLALGAPIHNAVPIEELDAVTGPLLVLNPHLLSPTERDRVLAWRSGPHIVIGPRGDGWPTPHAEVAGPDDWTCAVYGAELTVTVPAFGTKPPVVHDAATDPASFLEDLPYQPIPAEFLQACADVIAAVAGAVKVTVGTARVRVVTLEEPDGRLRLVVGNDGPGYVTAHLELAAPVAEVTVLTPFPPLPILPRGNGLDVKVPGRGVVVLQVTCA